MQIHIIKMYNQTRYLDAVLVLITDSKDCKNYRYPSYYLYAEGSSTYLTYS